MLDKGGKMKIEIVNQNPVSKIDKLPIYYLDNVSKTYLRGEKDGLKSIRLCVYNGDFISILGASGCGKSTLLRLLAGLLKPNSGRLLFKGQVVDKPLVSANLVFQNYALLPWLTVYNNIALGLGSKNLSLYEQRSQVEAMIELIGLQGYESKYPTELSGGMSQRVGFARALVMQPEVLLLDEPFSALDCVTARRLRSDFKQLLQTNKTSTRAAVMVTHNIEEAIAMSNRIVVLGGKPGCVIREIPVDTTNISNSYRNELSEKIYSLID